MLWNFFVLGIFIIIMSSCISQTSTETQTPIRLTTPSRTKTIPPTSTPSLTFTLSPVPSPTPLPTLTYDQYKAFFTNIYETNGDCSFPCWWGIMPGITTWDKVAQFFNNFGNPIPVAISIERGFEVAIARPEADYQVPVNFVVKNGVVTEIRVDPSLVDVNPIYKILKQVGTPEKIYLKRRPNYDLTFADIDIYLIYAQKGVVAPYTFLVSETTNPVKVCESNIAFKYIQFFEPGKLVDIYSADSQYFALETVTNLDVKKFSDIFSNKKNRCFEVSTEFWK